MKTMLYLFEYGKLKQKVHNLSITDKVENVSEVYIQTKSCDIETNNISANRLTLTECCLENKIRKINIKGIRITKKVLCNELYIADIAKSLEKFKNARVKKCAQQAKMYIMPSFVAIKKIYIII